jgi:hypothetical protein
LGRYYNWFLENMAGCVDWVKLAYDKGHSRVLVNTEETFSFYKRREICWLSELIMYFVSAPCSYQFLYDSPFLKELLKPDFTSTRS